MRQEFKTEDYKLGYEMYRAGRSAKDNPYHPVIDENKWNDFYRGWTDARTEFGPVPPYDKNAPTYTTEEVQEMEAKRKT